MWWRQEQNGWFYDERQLGPRRHFQSSSRGMGRGNQTQVRDGPSTPATTTHLGNGVTKTGLWMTGSLDSSCSGSLNPNRLVPGTRTPCQPSQSRALGCRSLGEHQPSSRRLGGIRPQPGRSLRLRRPQPGADPGGCWGSPPHLAEGQGAPGRLCNLSQASSRFTPPPARALAAGAPPQPGARRPRPKDPRAAGGPAAHPPAHSGPGTPAPRTPLQGPERSPQPKRPRNRPGRPSPARRSLSAIFPEPGRHRRCHPSPLTSGHAEAADGHLCAGHAARPCRSRGRQPEAWPRPATVVTHAAMFVQDTAYSAHTGPRGGHVCTGRYGAARSGCARRGEGPHLGQQEDSSHQLPEKAADRGAASLLRHRPRRSLPSQQDTALPQDGGAGFAPLQDGGG